MDRKVGLSEVQGEGEPLIARATRDCPVSITCETIFSAFSNNTDNP